VPISCGRIQLGCGWPRLLRLVYGEEAALEPYAGMAGPARLVQQPYGRPSLPAPRGMADRWFDEIRKPKRRY
jgi:hypothetical protein